MNDRRKIRSNTEISRKDLDGIPQRKRIRGIILCNYILHILIYQLIVVHGVCNTCLLKLRYSFYLMSTLPHK